MFFQAPVNLGQAHTHRNNAIATSSLEQKEKRQRSKFKLIDARENPWDVITELAIWAAQSWSPNIMLSNLLSVTEGFSYGEILHPLYYDSGYKQRATAIGSIYSRNQREMNQGNLS